MKALQIVIALGTLALAAHAQAESLISVPNSAALHWQDVAGTQGKVSYANVEGDIFGQGPYSAYVKFKKGTDNGLHQHSQTLPTLVVKGTFYAVIDGTRTEFPAGAYYKLPAKQVHESGCTSAEDCLLFQYQADKFDLVPVKG
ncbi:cupin domain-containing protein [Pseudomonas muyukensis]|uniref:Cupin domain-containing protein n=1 Tax=Pseudomonas muyukensis TaxID=2842357 RepID=A0ABX8MFP1_9PSED|nr:cupin domain-containing protein [Pseudomonas muyukensis]QXH36451.1 cupin domain-containing protein [Pseudomonas muyukensis]